MELVRHMRILLVLGLLLSRIRTTDGQWVAYQRSVWNYHTADLAIDNSTSTCYISGHDIGAWWFVDLGLQRVVDAVTISGALDAFQIRVGNESSEVGRRDAFKDNTLCFYSLGVDTRVMSAGDSLIQLDCVQPRVGRYVSIENVDPVYHSQMKLCHVDVHYR